MRKIIMLVVVFVIGSATADPMFDTYSKQDVHDVAWTIWAEARDQGNIGMFYVGSVIQNRAMDSNKSFVVICKKPKQFSCWNSITNAPTTNTMNNVDARAFELCLIIAQDMYDGKFRSVTTANHYYNPSLCSPSWGDKMIEVEYVGDHKFGKL